MFYKSQECLRDFVWLTRCIWKLWATGALITRTDSDIRNVVFGYICFLILTFY